MYVRMAREFHSIRIESMKYRFLLLAVPLVLLTGCGMVDHMTGEDQASEIRRTGLPAKALVLRIWDTGMTLNENPVVGFLLRVSADGIEPFEAETQAVIGRLDVPQIQPGAQVPVKYDPSDHLRVALDLYQDR